MIFLNCDDEQHFQLSFVIIDYKLVSNILDSDVYLYFKIIILRYGKLFENSLFYYLSLNPILPASCLVSFLVRRKYVCITSLDRVKETNFGQVWS